MKKVKALEDINNPGLYYGIASAIAPVMPVVKQENKYFEDRLKATTQLDKTDEEVIKLLLDTDLDPETIKRDIWKVVTLEVSDSYKPKGGIE